MLHISTWWSEAFHSFIGSVVRSAARQGEDRLLDKNVQGGKPLGHSDEPKGSGWEDFTQLWACSMPGPPLFFPTLATLAQVSEAV